jgi:signal transduction histidine kinase
MAFLDSLREYLQEIADQPSRASGPASFTLDPAIVRGQLIRCLERLEERHRAAGKPRSEDEYAVLLREWQAADRIVLFGKRMSQLLLQGMSQGASTQEIIRQVEVALARRLGLPDALSSVVRTLELDRLSAIAYTDIFNMTPSLGAVPIDAYASALRATRRTGSSISLTSIGRVYLEFMGRDAIRWLLHVEAAQSTGPRDDWRVSRESARFLLRKTLWTFHWAELGAAFPHSWVTFERLEALELIRLKDDPDRLVTLLEILPLGRELLGEVVSETESPMSSLAKTLLADLAVSAAESVSKPSHDEAAARVSAAEATARQARLVAHEIRNALVPVKTSLGALYREVLLNPSSETLSRRREGIDRGIDSVFRFVEQLVKLAALAARPPEPFDPLSVIRDAVSLVESESEKRIESSLPASLPPVSGHRDRVVMAITNVLRNAAQSTPATGAVIRIGAEPVEGGRAVLLTIEDNGPGVPENMRQAIFEEGISLRQGGSGMGLALVREVFEKEMRGLVDCGASQLGGARFVVRMPAAGTE